MAERDRLFAKHREDDVHRGALRLPRQRPRPAGARCSTGCRTSTPRPAPSSRSWRASRGPHARSSSKYQDRILFGKDTYEASRVPVLLAHVRDRRRVLRLLPRLPRVLEAVRPGPAGRRPAQALLRQRARWSRNARAVPAADAGSAAASHLAGNPTCEFSDRACRTDRALDWTGELGGRFLLHDVHGSLRGHRRRRFHRLASGGSARSARRARARRRQLHHRAPRGTWPISRTRGAGRRRPGGSRGRARARSRAWTTCCTRRRFRRCRDRSRTR